MLRALRADRPHEAPDSTVYLHIGTPKSGTTYLQALLWQNRRELRSRGLLYPGWRSEFRGGHHRAALELLSLDAGHEPASGLTAWPSLVRQIQRWEGSAVVSHELLSFAGPRAIDQIAADLAPRDVRVIVTARDLMRLIPSWWQEECRNGRSHSYLHLIHTLRADPPTGPGAWLAQFADLPRLVQRYGPVCPPDRVVIVPNGPPGTPPGRLPAAFLDVMQVSVRDLQMPADAGYPSLAAPAAELLRRLNAGPLRGRLDREDHERLIKLPLGHEVLDALERCGPRLTVPPEHRAWVVERSRELVAGLRRLDVDVAGDLSDLVPEVGDEPFVDPDGISPAELLDWSMDALVALLMQAQSSQRRVGVRERAANVMRDRLR